MRGKLLMCMLAVCALTAPGAAASTVGAGQFAADPGEVNKLTISETDAGLTFHDAGADITNVLAGCERVDAATATCTGVTQLEIELYDGKDEATLELLAGGPFDTSGGAGSQPQVFGGSGDDTLRGSGLSEQLVGGAGTDTILGGAGNDRLVADAGPDAVFGGPGNDEIVTAQDGWESGELVDGADPASQADAYSGGSGRDTVTYGTRHDDLHLSADNVAEDGAPNERDNLGADVENVFGGSGDDQIAATATPAPDEDFPQSIPGSDLYGGDGNDALAGGPGDDGLQGGDGNDELTGGPGRDSLGGQEGDDTLVGGPDPDYMTGENGDDFIDARDGSTFLRIGPGDDWVTCGLGEDHYLADYSEIYRLIPGETGDGCDHHNNPPDPTHLLVPDKTGTEAGGDVALGVQCPTKALGACGGSVQVTVPAPISAASAKKQPLVLAQGSVTLRRGHHKRARLVLTKEGRKYFKHHAKAVARALAKGKYTDLKRLKGRVKIRVQTD
jgi:Ca2+-binding RTX toxin-like protein